MDARTADLVKELGVVQVRSFGARAIKGLQDTEVFGIAAST